MSVDVAVIGATGHSGREACRLLLGHPDVGAIVPTSRGDEPFERVHGNLAGCGLEFVDYDELPAVDVAILCTPPGEAMRRAPALLERGVRVIDLSPDFRFADPSAYAGAYGRQHEAPRLIAEAACGITELAREQVRHARLVANPGCYVITAVLALTPLLEAGVVDLSAPLHLHALNGTTGAGSTPRADLLHAHVAGSVLPYSMSGHRHGPELEARLGDVAGEPLAVSLTTAHGDFARGIYFQASVPLRDDLGRAELLDLYLDRYGRAHEREHFVVVNAHAPRGALNEKEYDVYPQLRHVVGSNFCHVGVDRDLRQRIARVVGVTDNLVKGAAGSAIQNMNVMLGLDERAGLEAYAP